MSSSSTLLSTSSLPDDWMEALTRQIRSPSLLGSLQIGVDRSDEPDKTFTWNPTGSPMAATQASEKYANVKYKNVVVPMELPNPPAILISEIRAETRHYSDLDMMGDTPRASVTKAVRQELTIECTLAGDPEGMDLERLHHCHQPILLITRDEFNSLRAYGSLHSPNVALEEARTINAGLEAERIRAEVRATDAEMRVVSAQEELEALRKQIAELEARPTTVAVYEPSF